jgi:hypothetical protein
MGPLSTVGTPDAKTRTPPREFKAALQNSQPKDRGGSHDRLQQPSRRTSHPALRLARTITGPQSAVESDPTPAIHLRRC